MMNGQSSVTSIKSGLDHPQADLVLARQIILKHLGDFPARVFLFGSRATGQAGRTSDIDIAIWPDQQLPPGLLTQIRTDLHESGIIYNVDVVNLSQASPELRKRVLEEGIPWTK